MLTKVLISVVDITGRFGKTLLEFLDLSQTLRAEAPESTTFRISMSEKSLENYQHFSRSDEPKLRTHSCANHAAVTVDSLSRSCPNCCGCAVTTTTAFCTVDLVTSEDLFFSLLAGICLVHDIPNKEVTGELSLFRRSVK